jgi:hypothetical protein
MPPIFGRIASYISFDIFPMFIGIILRIKVIMVEILNKKVDSKKTKKE